MHFSRCLNENSDGEDVTSDIKSNTSNREGTMSNGREFNSRNKQMIRGGEPESLSKWDVSECTEKHHNDEDDDDAHSGSLYLSVTPKFYTKVSHQTTGLTPN